MDNSSMNNKETYSNQFGRNRGTWTTFDRIADYYGISCYSEKPKFLSRNPKYDLPYCKDYEKYLSIREQVDNKTQQITFKGELFDFIIEARKRIKQQKTTT